MKINPDAVRGDASRLQSTGEDISSIGGEASGVSIPWSAYGLIGRPFAAVLGQAYKLAGEGIKSYGQVVGRTGEQLNKAASVLEGEDDSSGDNLAK